MNCQEVMELMQRQLDDDLDEGEMEVLMNHTRHCPDCASMFERLMLLSAELTSLPKVTPSYSLVDAIIPQLEQIELFGQQGAAAEPASGSNVESFEPAARRAKRERRWPSMRLIGGVIAAGIVAGLFLVTYKPGIVPDLAGGKFAADGSNNAAQEETEQAANSLMLRKYANEESAAAPEVRTETMDAAGKSDGASAMDIETDVKNKSESNSGYGNADTRSGGDEDKGSITSDDSDNSGEPSPEPLEAAAMDSEDGGGSNSFEGEAGPNDAKEINTDQKSLAAALPDAASPDGKYIAQAEGYVIKIYAASDQSVVHESTRKNGKLANLKWSEDSAELTYEVHVEQGAIEKYAIDMTTGEDKKAEQ
ncbi:zf-HC2 domain-containing protein [Paenibacillus alkaliterrae]|uniref:zf-HC2 domain-containing protein n=1 Tax=Paenibacillus alkaliterrae TaxID=320909 RepID=UPI001F1CAC08|nr:zf-HC2 domain-containing protein [Paenibacillus alkaliterrae]MCF2940829.1 zf-HC2 domain-containing protein [Paenibacillus alkaliterrae]